MATKNAEPSAGAAAPATTDNTAAALPASLVQAPAGTTAPAPPRQRPVFEPASLPIDEFHGKGGDYVMGADGIRRPATPAA